MIEIQTIDYEPIPEKDVILDSDGSCAYPDGLPYSRKHYEVIEWCCEALQFAIEDWNGGPHLEILYSWDESLDNLTKYLICTTGEVQTMRAETQAYKYCPYCKEEIIFKEIGRIILKPKAIPPQQDVLYQWFGPDEIPWWESP